MYVDKKSQGVKAVQPLSRLNRTCPGKDDTFVLDCANEARGIQESFRPFVEATAGLGSARPASPKESVLPLLCRRSVRAFLHRICWVRIDDSDERTAKKYEASFAVNNGREEQAPWSTPFSVRRV